MIAKSAPEPTPTVPAHIQGIFLHFRSSDIKSLIFKFFIAKSQIFYRKVSNLMLPKVDIFKKYIK